MRSIPTGKVATYGQVALLAGNMHAARQVGAVLHGISEVEDDVPWQRVINASGGISTFKVGAGELQVALLKSEGVEVERTDAGPRVALRQWQWRPDFAEVGPDLERFGQGPEPREADQDEEDDG